MKKAFVAAAFLILASSLCVLGADTWKGSISDKMCGADHKGKDPAACTKACAKNGYVLVVSKDKILDISNQKDEKVAADLMKHAGHDVEVTGTMSADGKSVAIDKIVMPAAKKKM